MIDLSGRTALITGAGRNVGAGIAATLGRGGAAIAVNDLVAERAQSVADALRTDGIDAIAVPADVTDHAAVDAMVHVVEERFGALDILVNNAGVPAEGSPSKRFREMPIEEWDRFIDLNLRAVLYCTRSVLDGMCERAFGRVVTITSEAGRTGQPPGLTLYAAAKAGAAGFTRVLAREVGRHGVTANCVSLGPMENMPVREVLRAMPMRRYGTPADVGAAVAYLSSDGASWVTGQTLAVNGGYFTL